MGHMVAGGELFVPDCIVKGGLEGHTPQKGATEGGMGWEGGWPDGCFQRDGTGRLD
jgi:hypothetical protein